MVEAGRAKALTCPMHEDAIFPLQHRLAKDDSIILDCYACGYKHIVGQTLYNLILDKVEDDLIRLMFGQEKVSAEKEEPHINILEFGQNGQN
jgi:hypothetical protein